MLRLLFLRFDDGVLRESIVWTFLSRIHSRGALDDFRHSLERHLLDLQYAILEFRRLTHTIHVVNVLLIENIDCIEIDKTTTRSKPPLYLLSLRGMISLRLFQTRLWLESGPLLIVRSFRMPNSIQLHKYIFKYAFRQIGKIPHFLIY